MRRGALWTLVAAVVAIVAWWYWPSDERRIRARVDELARSVSVPAAESELQRVARLATLRRCLAHDVVIEATAEVPALAGRDAVLGFASQMASRLGPLDVEVLGTDITVSPQDEATAAITVSVRAERETSATRRFDGQELRLQFAREDGDWVLRRVSPIATLDVPE